LDELADEVANGGKKIVNPAHCDVCKVVETVTSMNDTKAGALNKQMSQKSRKH